MNLNLIVYLCSSPPQHRDETGRKLKIFKDTDQRVGVRSEILPIFVAPGWNLSGAPARAAGGTLGTMPSVLCGPGCQGACIDLLSQLSGQQPVQWNVIESRIMRTLHADRSSAPHHTTLCKAKSRNCKWKLLMTEGIADWDWLLAGGKFSVHLFE